MLVPTRKTNKQSSRFTDFLKILLVTSATWIFFGLGMPKAFRYQ